tara:strand:+ start:173 stop:385 length:213 start_codon:yes stop_codon:yes gene_type:complete
MYQKKIRFLESAAAKAFDRQIAHVLKIASRRPAESAFLMITSDNSQENLSRKFATDDPELFALLSAFGPE